MTEESNPRERMTRKSDLSFASHVTTTTTKADHTASLNWLDGSDSPQNYATYAFSLGVVFGAFCVSAVVDTRDAGLIPLYIFLAALALFHFSEFLCTALFNGRKLKLSSFLLDQSTEYRMAQAAGVAEYLIEWYLAPTFKGWNWISMIGTIVLLIGQSARTLAMWHAKSNFSHEIVTVKENDHVLVTTGIYRFLRHPSYFGFYYWALGSQLVLVNPFCFVGFAVILHTFFRRRIAYEEETLGEFFERRYEEYRRKTKTGMVGIE